MFILNNHSWYVKCLAFLYLQLYHLLCTNKRLLKLQTFFHNLHPVFYRFMCADSVSVYYFRSNVDSNIRHRMT